MIRPYLVWCSANQGQCAAELFGEERLFDVAIHDYSDSQLPITRLGEFWIPAPGQEKLETAGVNIPALPPYEQYAFLDDDLEISTDQLNRMFQIGSALGLGLYQPALSRGSYGSHPHLFQAKSEKNYIYTGTVRHVPFVEIMMPFMSREALELLLPTFSLNVSGWSLDTHYWPRRWLDAYVVDRIAVDHKRAPARRNRRLRNGKTPQQEYSEGVRAAA